MNARIELPDPELLRFAKDLADPDWCLSVPFSAKVTIARLVAGLEEQQARLDMLTMACEEAEECGRETISIKGLRAALTATHPETES